jgi:hypothetical protein
MVMRARRHRLASGLVLVAGIVLSALLVPAASTVEADGPVPNCPAGTAWDNRVKRCV